MVEEDERVLLAKERTDLAIERNRLASIRTFLSWVRTGLASVAAGLAIIRLLPYEHREHALIAQVMGSILVFLGIAIFALSFFDYRKSYKWLKLQGSYAGSLFSITTVTFVLIVISFLMLVISAKWMD